ncbi:MAG: DNA repair protein RecO C-terminal domain-containing protein [Trueperaceae bacterium]|nr:DNA repair protein RecO C-terminal domain-containing protein [Trueperaceae bacterium]
MATQRYRVREGIVVRRTPLPSGDVVVTLLSPDGKWRAVARKGRLLGGNPGRLSLFHDVTLQVYQRRADDLAVVAQVRLNGALSRLSDPAVYPYAHLLAELADRLTVDVHVGEPLHAWLASGLRGLNEDDDPERVALVHAWMLLRVAGLGPDASDEAAPDHEGDPRFDLVGGRLARTGEGIALRDDTAHDLRILIIGRARDALRQPFSDRATHWRLLARYVAWHVDDLRSLGGVAGSRSGPPTAGTFGTPR